MLEPNEGSRKPPTCGLLHSTPSGELVERTPHRFWWCPYRTREIQSRTISIFLCIRQHHAWARTAEHHGSQDASPTVKPPPGVAARHRTAARSPSEAAVGPLGAPNLADLAPQRGARQLTDTGRHRDARDAGKVPRPRDREE